MCSLRPPTTSSYGKSVRFAHRRRRLSVKGGKWQGGKGARGQLPFSPFAICICISAYLLICIFLAHAKTQLITTHISLGKNVEDYLLITETGGIKTTVTIDFYNQKGDLGESIRKILPSHATIKIQVSNFLHDTGIIMVNSDSDGIAGQHYYAVQSNQKGKNRVLISVPLQIKKSASVSREIGTGQFCIPYVDVISAPRGISNSTGTGMDVDSYIVVSDASEERYRKPKALVNEVNTSGSIFEMRFYNREGEAVSKVKSEIGKNETKIFKLNEYINNRGGIPLHDYQGREANFGKVNLNITEGDVICEYVQFHPSIGILIIPGVIYDSEYKLLPKVPIFLYRFPLFSLQMPKGKMARWQDGKMASLPPFLEKLFITDIFGYGPAVNIEVLNNSSDILAQTKKLLPPHGTSMLELEDYTTNVVFPLTKGGRGLLGAIKIHSQAQIAAVYYFSPAAPQVSTSTLYSYAASSAGVSEGESKKLPTSFVIPWLSPCDNMEIHLLITNTANEVNEIQINLYHKDGSPFKEGQEGKEARGQEGKSVPKVLLRDASALLKPGIIHEWQPGILFPKDEQGSILLDSSSSNLAVLLLGVNANTGQIVMSVQAQIQLKGE